MVCRDLFALSDLPPISVNSNCIQNVSSNRYFRVDYADKISWTRLWAGRADSHFGP